jgi:hypothetical protein
LNSIDILGKCDTVISKLPPDTSGHIAWNGMRSVPGHNKYDLEYSLRKLKPVWAQQFEWGRQNLDAYRDSNYAAFRLRNGTPLYFRKDQEEKMWKRTETSLLRSSP